MVVINKLGRNGCGLFMVIGLFDHLAGGNEENYKNFYPGKPVQNQNKDIWTAKQQH
jgi:hypothetical protein